SRRRRTTSAKAVRCVSWLAPGDAPADDLVLLDDIFDHGLARGVLRAPILFGDDRIQLAREIIALGRRPQLNGAAQMALRRCQVIHTLRGSRQRLRDGGALGIGQLDIGKNGSGARLTENRVPGAPVIRRHSGIESVLWL